MRKLTWEALVCLVEEWSLERGLDERRPGDQILKLMEESGELAAAYLRGEQHELKDAMGDILVVLIILAQQLDLSLKDCLVLAYSEIEPRKGTFVNGVFVKESDLKRT